MQSRKPWRTICVVGNIATGKSTLVKLLADNIPNSIAIPESFDENPFLRLYLQDKPRWAFTNAVRYLYDYGRVYQELTVGRDFEYYFIDAGVPTNRRVYGRYLADTGIVTPAENDFYNILGDLLTRMYEYPQPDAYIFVEASMETCFRRMHGRGWEYQTENVERDYLIALEKYFVAFREALQVQGAPVLVVNTDELDLTSDAGRGGAVERVGLFLARGAQKT